ncbi:hypothetical protein [Paracidovorax anthurii]|uniref:Uncharacterized protein n=1 Tax=Paracidovorax anthurii TaxID=78229 RepID=A0A328ZKB8_9BURK|nr:hypothetical protein [Paracidovorax anthurii]RAR86084.1 hypothetical protein AX018_100245 [Paracidovorax anthurii]
MFKADEQQYLKFRTWMLQPGSLPEQRKDVDGLHAMQTLLEDALWAAWQAGYREGVRQQQPGDPQ